MVKLFWLWVMMFMIQAAQGQSVEVYNDKEGNKVLKGLLTKENLSGDTAFKWFAENQKDYTPYTAALKTFKKNKEAVDFIVFAGTWCHDTHFIVPRFFRLLEEAGISDEHVIMYGVDHAKKSVAKVSESFRITGVPTIIVLKNGKEAGRVVEYGKYGMFDKELGEIIAATE